MSTRNKAKMFEGLKIAFNNITFVFFGVSITLLIFKLNDDNITPVYAFIISTFLSLLLTYLFSILQYDEEEKLFNEHLKMMKEDLKKDKSDDELEDSEVEEDE